MPPESANVDQRISTKLGKAVKWAYVMNWTEQGASALILFVLAGIVGPHDFGIVAMAMIFAAFLDIFLDQGFTTALIQRKETESAHFDSVFWLLLGSSIILMSLTFLLSGWWADANKTPELQGILNVIALRLPIGALSRVQSAIFQREMNYRDLAIRNSSAVIAGGITGIVLAVLGYGPWALVAQILAKESVGTILIWKLCPWRPSFRFSKKHAHDLYAFSRANMLARIGVFVIQQVDALIVGLFFGPTAVGLYRLAGRIVSLALQLLTRSLQAVSLPELSRNQSNPIQLKSSMLKLLRASVTTTLPIFVVVAASSQLIMASISSEWQDAAGILSILCLLGIIQSVTQFTAPILQAASRPGILAALSWLQGLINVGIFVLVAKLLPDGSSDAFQMESLAWGRIAALLLITAPSFIIYALPRTGLHVGDIWKVSWPSITSAILGGSTCLLLLHFSVNWTSYPILKAIAVGGVSGAVSIAVLTLIDPIVRRKIQEQFRKYANRA